MRLQKINTQIISFKPYISITDEVISGVYTGEKTITYGTIKEERMSVKPKGGNASILPFGVDTDYSLVATTCNKSCAMNEQSLVWVGIPSTEPNNYRVEAVYKTINSIQYALRECR